MKKLLADAGYRRNWIAERIERLLDALGNFAAVQSLSINACRGGENTFVIDDWQGAASRAELLGFLQKTDDVYLIYIHLILHCEELGPDGERKKLEIKCGGSIQFGIDLDNNGSLNTDDETPMYFALGLEVDIYAPLSWAECRDNTELATLNGPRLSAFLQRLEHQIPVEFIEVEASGYTAGRYGFLAVDESERS
ncbi:hypothetical protein IC235_01190 [Hymenobacter sp. BT664]|uniref:Uncharacterized protein n=1 Tax=Hymenobacter montanus TaxID=2771359 RepID=A0A927BAE6_9BACT|nr:hypothetical protein [Hymenobacter montanus]MBD2766503.1 hypothetical protein [Hymenobacter montanus]